MTRSAPIDRSVSSFPVASTPVTVAPYTLASCTAKVPTAPPAPLIKTLCPGWTRPSSRTPCTAMDPDVGTAAACSNVRPAGFRSNLASRTVAYSANAPPQIDGEALPEDLIARPEPRHVRADRLDVAGQRSVPGTRSLGLRSPAPMILRTYGSPLITCQT